MLHTYLRVGGLREGGGVVAQLVEAKRQEVPGSISGGVLGNFQVAQSCPHSEALGSTQPLAEMSIKEFPWG